MTAPTLPPESRILFVLMGSLGDVARGLALIEPIRRTLPRARLSWLVEPACAGLVRLHPSLDSVIVFDRKKPVRGVLALRRALKHERFDLALDLQRHAKSGLFTFLTGAPRRIGFNRKDAKELNWLFQTETIAPFDSEAPKLDHYRRFLDAIGVPDDADVDFGIRPASHPALEPIRTARNRSPLVGFVLGSSWESKDWPVEGYAALRDRVLTASGAAVVLIGDHTHRDRAASLAGDPRVHNFAGRTTLSELIELLSLMTVCVGPDSGPGHLAAMVRTPYVSLFGPTSPSRTAPYGSSDLVVQSPIGCAPCYLRRCPGLGTLCMRFLGVDQVWTRVLSFLD